MIVLIIAIATATALKGNSNATTSIGHISGLVTDPMPPGPAPGPALRIMPLGDSITQWECGTMGTAASPFNDRGDVASFGGYRGPLFQELQREWGSLYAFETVGGQHGCGSHEGHSGWTCQMLADVIVGSATAYKPDVVMLMCGTNDLYYGPSTLNPEKQGNVSQVLERINLVISRIFSVLPNATVLLSTISDINATKCLTYAAGACPPSMPADIAAVNAALPAQVVSPLTAAGRRVYLHDVNAEAQWVETDYFTWGIHRSEAGFAKMGAAWKKALLAHVTPPAGSCSAALEYACGVEQTAKSHDAALCNACLLHAKSTLTRYKCSAAEEVSSFMYRYILRESCSQFDSLPLTSLTTSKPLVHRKREAAYCKE
jgi:lysophospholipase L1-like esterase